MLLFLLIIISNLAVSEISESLFVIDESMIKAEMADLIAIESYVNNNDVTLSQLLTEKNELLLNDLLILEDPESQDVDPPLGIPSFLWGFVPGVVPGFGCLLGLGGILTVYFVTNSREETEKALLGCITGVILFHAIAFLFGAFSA